MADAPPCKNCTHIPSPAEAAERNKNGVCSIPTCNAFITSTAKDFGNFGKLCYFHEELFVKALAKAAKDNPAWYAEWVKANGEVK